MTCDFVQGPVLRLLLFRVVMLLLANFMDYSNTIFYVPADGIKINSQCTSASHSMN